MARGYPDFEGDKSAVYDRSGWAAEVGEDKILVASTINNAWSVAALVLYDVPAGKTLYIVTVSGSIHASGIANYDHFFYGRIVVLDVTAGTGPLAIGGQGGAGIVCNPPIVIPAEHTVWIQIENWAGVDADLDVVARGYEV